MESARGCPGSTCISLVWLESIVAQDGPGRTGPSRTDTVRDVKFQFFQDGSGRGCPQDVGGLYFMVKDAIVAPYLHLH